MDKKTHPWICRRYEPPEKATKAVLKATSGFLHLLWFLNPQDESAPLGEMHAQWEVMKNAFRAANPGPTSVIPLCAATDPLSKVLDHSCKDHQWHQCTDAAVFPGPRGNAQVPYALWCLSIQEPLPASDDTSQRFCLEKGAVSCFTPRDAKDNHPLVDVAMSHSILAQGFALQWLMENHRTATLRALADALCE